MLVPLREAHPGSCGAKAATLGALLRAGLPVPDGYVVPFAVQRRGRGERPGGVRPGAERQTSDPPGTTWPSDGRSWTDLPTMLAEGLGALAEGPVAVRSSASGEDSAASSAAGRYETVLGVRGADAIAVATRRCWASLTSARTLDPSAPVGPAADAGPPSIDLPPSDSPSMAVIIQPLVDAEVAGVLFTPAHPDDATRIEASWGLGAAVVGGEVTPDVYEVAADEAVSARIADKHRRIDRSGARTVAREVPAARRTAPCLAPEEAVELARLGQQISVLLGGPQDIEWARSGGSVQILQARPITAELPRAAADPSPPGARGTLATRGLPGTRGLPREHGRPDEHALHGTPGSAGRVTGPARIVRGPEDFSRVRAGDVLICPWTDPSWTPLLRLVAGIVTEIGGALSHAAIIAREQRIPAVLGVTGAVSMLREGQPITLDGATGTLALGPEGPAR
ncbi:hypothetical protein BH708_10940 [Brachybacterium sp. P6-10-X1]|uniref:PEP/pyruvate-binding domain-containing protein n=1 Tax=Brachybacterium sp. P6-10-X1 TaxID=1903186 RepID=UPI0009717C21|nr:PEP/pyruvate-binding domain-containing protein [Brachybacterium sp. P6-10-X1]APX33140.1 hypothetical protein BH708_10940 [Brachybacterium sp. P6-10-X1]